MHTPRQVPVGDADIAGVAVAPAREDIDPVTAHLLPPRRRRNGAPFPALPPTDGAAFAPFAAPDGAAYRPLCHPGRRVSADPGSSLPGPCRAARAVLDPGSGAGATIEEDGAPFPRRPLCHPGRRAFQQPLSPRTRSEGTIRGPACRGLAGPQGRCWTPARGPGRQLREPS